MKRRLLYPPARHPGRPFNKGILPGGPALFVLVVNARTHATRDWSNMACQWAIKDAEHLALRAIRFP